MEETFRRQPHRPSLAGIMSVTEGDEAAVVLEDALGTEGGAIQVSGEVLQGRLAPANRSHSGKSRRRWPSNHSVASAWPHCGQAR